MSTNTDRQRHEFQPSYSIAPPTTDNRCGYVGQGNEPCGQPRDAAIHQLKRHEFVEPSKRASLYPRGYHRCPRCDQRRDEHDAGDSDTPAERCKQCGESELHLAACYLNRSIDGSRRTPVRKKEVPSDTQPVAPERVWLIKDERGFGNTFYRDDEPELNPEIDVEYILRSTHDSTAEQLGAIVMALLQGAFNEARELALEVPLAFPNGAPVPTNWAGVKAHDSEVAELRTALSNAMEHSIIQHSVTCAAMTYNKPQPDCDCWVAAARTLLKGEGK